MSLSLPIRTDPLSHMRTGDASARTRAATHARAWVAASRIAFMVCSKTTCERTYRG